jgi:hypothetical protein
VNLHGLRITSAAQLAKTYKLGAKVNQRQDVEPATSFFYTQNVSSKLLICMACALHPQRSSQKHINLPQQ